LRLLILLAALLALRGWGQVWWVVRDLERYRTLQVPPPWWVYAPVHAAWGAIFTLFAVGLWRRRAWALRWLWSTLLVYALFTLGWFAAFAEGDYNRQRFLFWVVFTGVGLSVAFFLLRRPKVRRAFQNKSP
jgi:hypothetical protein